MKKIKVDLPEKSLWYLFVCAGIILLIAVAGVFPLYKLKSDRRQEVKRLENQLAAQKDLGPIYATLTQALKEKKEPALPCPQRKAVSREEAGKFPALFKTLAEKAGLRLVSITPDMSKLGDNPPYVLQVTAVRGEFHNFRKLLIELGEIPYLEKIEELKLERLTDTLELKLKIWLAVSA